jgi:hypothetical protein
MRLALTTKDPLNAVQKNNQDKKKDRIHQLNFVLTLELQVPYWRQRAWTTQIKIKPGFDLQ